jgi:transcriptional regulator with XRE-family HTH domain/tetratricopeptide (TPR) repeat protein
VSNRGRPNLRRARIARGWGQTDFAKHLSYLGAKLEASTDDLGVDQSRVSEWELGKAQPGAIYTMLICRLLELPPEQLDLPPLPAFLLLVALPNSKSSAPSLSPENRLAVHGDAAPRGGTMTVGGTGTAHSSVPDHEGIERHQQSDPFSGEDDVKRRAFLRWLSVAATNVALGHAGADVADHERLNRAAAFLPNLDDVHLDRHVRASASLWAAFGAATFKPSVLPTVHDQIRVLTRSLQQPHNSAQHRQLCTLAGDLFQLAGEVFFDANQYTNASQYYATAIDASKDANAHDLWACAIARDAFVAIYEHQYQEALVLLDAADRVAKHGDSLLSTRHWVHAVAAEALAGMGDLVACQRALDRAEQVYLLNRPVANGGWLRFDGSRLAEQRGACFTRLERPELAEPALREALTLDLSARRRGLVVSDLALVALQRHEIEESCGYGEMTIEIARNCPSGIIKRRLADLGSRVAPFTYLPCVKQFTDHLGLL